MKTITTVKNPLTVIAIFAGLAEVAGTVVLPFVAVTNQLVYIWFLMLFPTLLVIFFFLTLNYNSRVLYAPSDFRDESNYMEIFRPSSTTERLVKLEAEVQESIDEGDETHDEEADNIEQNAYNIEKNVDLSQNAIFGRMANDPKSKYILAENLVIDRLSYEFKMPARREMALNGNYGISYLFDAIFNHKSGPILVEIKLLPEKAYIRRLSETLRKIEQAVLAIPDYLRLNVRVLLVLVHEQSNIDAVRIKNQINQIVNSCSVQVEIRMYNLKVLISEVGIK